MPNRSSRSQSWLPSKGIACPSYEHERKRSKSAWQRCGPVCETRCLWRLGALLRRSSNAWKPARVAGVGIQKLATASDIADTHVDNSQFVCMSHSARSMELTYAIFIFVLLCNHVCTPLKHATAPLSACTCSTSELLRARNNSNSELPQITQQQPVHACTSRPTNTPVPAARSQSAPPAAAASAPASRQNTTLPSIEIHSGRSRESSQRPLPLALCLKSGARGLRLPSRLSQKFCGAEWNSSHSSLGSRCASSARRQAFSEYT
jgi:hypothetical protein